MEYNHETIMKSILLAVTSSHNNDPPSSHEITTAQNTEHCYTGSRSTHDYSNSFAHQMAHETRNYFRLDKATRPYHLKTLNQITMKSIT